MAFNDKDIKLLWGKSAARCAMPHCRLPLVIEKADPSSTLHVGEMAHIVGEEDSEKSPRGISKLPIDQRNRYSNLILLCPTHHTEIDKDVADWPIERLHVIKRDHELWIEEQLGQVIDEKIQVYHDFIDRVAVAFDLANWEWTCDHLFRQIMPVEFPDGVYQLNLEFFRAILPGIFPDFESSLSNLSTRARAYLDHYMSDAEMIPGDPRIMNRKRYKNVSHTDWAEKERLLDEYRLWNRNCTFLLCNLVKSLNDFSDEVRKHLRPTFFLRKGKFCVHDFMGLSGGTDFEQWFVPDRYYTDDDLRKPVEPPTTVEESKP